MTDDDLVRYREAFEPPTDDEFGDAVDDAPAGFEGWPQWVAVRWPSAGTD